MEPRNTNRRNGQPASCEPCRLNKTKCDHSSPKCHRCIRRGIADRCFYHPAPLTKRRAHGTTADQVDALAMVEQLPKRRRASGQSTTSRSTQTILSMPLDNSPDTVPSGTYKPGYLGPTSFQAGLHMVSDGCDDGDAMADSDDSDQERTHQQPLTRTLRVQIATTILTVFEYFPIIEELIQWSLANMHYSGFPLSFVAQFTIALRATVERYRLTTDLPDAQLVNLVLRNSGKPLHVPNSLKARDLYTLCTGEHLRLEVIGLVCATAGKAMSLGCCAHIFKTKETRMDVLDDLHRASSACALLCSLINSGNDITTWMLIDVTNLTAIVTGLSGPPAWKRIGELANQIYALGIHIETITLQLPEWLVETRRRVYCSAYIQDKTLATFLGRPVTLSKRYANVSLPSDLSDEEVTGEEGVLEAAKNDLDQDGWNSHARHLQISWIRVRYLSSTFREEILDLALIGLRPDTERQLLDVSRRLQSFWASVPTHLKYWPTCWQEGLGSNTCLMLLILRQTHWYNEFMIRKLLAPRHSLVTNLELLRVSMDLLSHSLTLGAVHDKSYDIYMEFVSEVVLYGIPSASVLANALQEQQRSGEALPASISRAEAIRMLSVLISHLASATQVNDSGARPGEANYQLCKKACKVFTRIVDNVLDPQPARMASSSSADLDLDFELDFDALAATGLGAFEGLEFPAIADGQDWGAMAQWTSI